MSQDIGDTRTCMLDPGVVISGGSLGAPVGW